MNSVYIALPFGQFVLSLFLANLVVVSDPANRVNRLFTFFLLAMAGWGIAIFGMRDAFPDGEVAFTREKIALAIIPFGGIFFYHFVLRYTGVERRHKLLWVLYALGAISAGLSLAGFAATEMVVKFYGFAPRLGWAFPLVLLASYPPVVLALIRLSKAVKSEPDAAARQRLNLLRLGIFASVLGATSDFLPSLGVNIYPLGILGNLFFVGLTTWGVTRYRLMELRLVLRRGLAYSTVSSFIFTVYGISFGAVFLFTRNLSVPAVIMTVVGSIILVGVLMQPLMARVQEMVDRAFFRERVDRIAGLSRLNELTKNITDFIAVATGISDTVRRTVQADSAAIYLPDDRRQRFVAVATTGDPDAHAGLPARGAVVSRLRRTLTPVRVSELAQEDGFGEAGAAELDDLSDSGADILVPMSVGGALTGILVLGGRLVGTNYSSEDVSFLRAAADQAAIAVENARLYADVQREATERAAVAELARVVGSTLDLKSVFARCAEQVRNLLPVDRVVITRIDDSQQNFEFAHVDGLEVPGWGTGATGNVADAPFRSVVQQHSGAIIMPRRSGDGAGELESAGYEVGLRSMISVPLVSKGLVVGTLNLESTSPEQFGNDQLELARRIGAQVTNAVANSLLYEQALQLAAEREARVRLDAENRELQRINEAKIAFLSTVSHELRTPLTSMMAFADILQRNKSGHLTEKDISNIDVIRRNGRRLSILIGDLLDVSRIDSGVLKLSMSEFEMQDLLVDLHESFTPQLELKGQLMTLLTPDKPVTVTADRDRIAQVMSNLMSNASKYSGEKATVWVTMRADADRVYVEVRDEGIGITDADLKQLFTSFFRAENEETRAEPGTGLGLVIAKGIVTMHSGNIHIASEYGTGTIVSIEFARISDGATGHAQAA